ncbi:HAD-IC family P-type ATPase [Micromonospora marina]|uniref:HAD-IC family P-type ATPase n=1 Tax=Micromonospora marina TaxID=307120 RepID=UPI00345260C5
MSDDGQRDVPSDRQWHAVPVSELLRRSRVDRTIGLDGEEVTRRRERYGPNTLPVAGGQGVLRRAARQFHHPLVYVLVAAGAVTAVLEELVDAAVILAVVLLNAIIGFTQESKAEAALAGLRSMARTDARVRRDGREQRIPSEDIVPGDVVLLAAGDKVPADLRLLELTELRTDESALTGESLPVLKDPTELPVTTAPADRRNMAYSGTLVTGGTATGVAVATGAGTELGQIHRLVSAAEVLATPLTRQLAKVSKILMIVILVLAAVTFAVGLARGQDAVDTFTAAVALAVGAIPEGLPAAVTITLAVGVTRMARRRAIIRRLPAIETLGSTTVICSDKTGTLTENQMTVRRVWTPVGGYTVTGAGYAPDGALHDETGSPVTRADDHALRWTLTAGALCNDARLRRVDDRWVLVGDPTEGAMRVTPGKAGIDLDHVDREHQRLATIPFSSERQYMATLHRDLAGGGTITMVKGSVEKVLALAEHQMGSDGSVHPVDRVAFHTAAERLAAEGLRVLATAVDLRQDPGTFDEQNLSGLVVTGLQAMLDPPRPAAAPAVAACRTAGITVKMITGDHATTAVAIATQLGLLDADDDRPRRVLTGTDLDALPAAEFTTAADDSTVFARVSPEQKLRLITALQHHGHVVAVTGDGVNDAPALRQADIGIAMARTGTDVAKEAADMILTDDDFATIEAAVEQGRGVFDNLTKFIVWTLPTNLGQGLLILSAILVGADLPLLPTQILWINMTTAVLLGLTLAFEPQEPGIMRRPPRDPARPIITGALTIRILLVATLLVAGSWWMFQWEQDRGASLAEARTAALNLFVVVSAAYLVACRSLTRPVRRLGLLTNPWVPLGIAAQAAGQLAITYLPTANAVFDTAPLTPEAWLRIAALAALAAAVVALDNRLRRHRLTAGSGRTRSNRDSRNPRPTPP